jgi:hypothetical protein
VGIAAYRFGKTSPNSADIGDRLLIVESESLDFGEVFEARGFRWTLPIKNPGDQDVAIEGFETSCNCTSVEPKSLLVRAGETASVQVTLDLTHADRSEIGKPIRSFSVKIGSKTRGGGSRPQVWTIKGRVRSLIELEPNILTFWDGVTQGRAASTKQVLVRGHVPLDRLNTRYDPKAFKVTVATTEDPMVAKLEVTPIAGMVLGQFSSDILVEVSPDGLAVSSKPLGVRGVVHSSVQILPDHVSWGPKTLGSTTEETIVIHSLNGERLTLVGTDFTSQQMTVTSVSTTSEGVLRVCVKQCFETSGSCTSTSKFTIRRPDGSLQVVAFTGTYQGIGSRAEPSPRTTEKPK